MHRQQIMFVLCLLIFSPPLWAIDKMAVLVGISQYSGGSNLSNLKYSINDITDISKLLKQQGFEVVTFADTKATAFEIRRFFNYVENSIDKQLVFVFSGHGFSHLGRNYLATYGTGIEYSQNKLQFIPQTALSLSELETLINRSGATQKLMLIDACRNQTGVKLVELNQFVQPKDNHINILFSTLPKQISYENDVFKHGVFSEYVIQALKGGAANKKGDISFQSLTDYVIDAVKIHTLETRQYQTPYAIGQISDTTPLFSVAPIKKPAIKTAPTISNKRFIKLATNGEALSDDARQWSCVKDTQTNLIWEVKQTQGLHNKDATYSWYNPDPAINGGWAGVKNKGECQDSRCDTQGFVKVVNQERLCGFNDWYLPTIWGSC